MLKSLIPVVPLLLAVSFSSMLVAQVAPVTPAVVPPGYILVDDMWMPDPALAPEAVYSVQPWPGGVVPYAFDAAVSQGQADLMRLAMWEIEAVSTVRFVPWVPAMGVDRVHIQPNALSANQSSSALGKIGGQQPLNVGANHWTVKYVLVHELMHALGFLHEQSRPDRDSFVTINYSNISTTACGGTCVHNFNIDPNAATVGPYDFRSIMHYGRRAFSTNGLPTIEPKPLFAHFANQMGNLTYMTALDAQGIAFRYGAPASPVITSISPTSVVAATGTLTMDIYGSGFFEGSPVEDGVQGTKVFFGGVECITTFVSASHVRGVIPWHLLEQPSIATSVYVENDVMAGFRSNVVNFGILNPPCTAQNDQLGSSLAAIGDVDADGVADYVLGSPGFGGLGQVACYSGSSGQLLWVYTGGVASATGRALANVGDLNGDGRADVAVGAPSHNSATGQVRILNGGTGAVIRTLNGPSVGSFFGQAVASCGDITGDGVPDLVIGAPGQNQDPGQARVYSGSTGALLRIHTGTQNVSRFGSAVAGGLDFGTDGIPDYIIGAPLYDTPNGVDSGRVTFFSGSSGNVVINKDGDGAADYLGSSVAIIPAVSGNSASVVAGAPDYGDAFGNHAGAGYVRVYRGALLLGGYSTFSTHYGSQVGDRFGECVVYAGDLNDDGFPDLAVGAPQGGFVFGPATGPGYVRLLSANGDRLHQTEGSTAGDLFGSAVTCRLDVDRDGMSDLLVGAPSYDSPCPNAGRIHLLHPRIPPARNKILITEVSNFGAALGHAGLEITNFTNTAINLANHVVRWNGGQAALSPLAVTLPSVPVAAGESVVIVGAGGAPPSVPPHVTVLSVLPAINATSGSLVVALENPRGIIIDEVRIAGTNNQEPTFSFGGRFRGFVRNVQPGPFVGPIRADRIWGLDSNGGSDWTSHGASSFGLENTSSGIPGYDPQPLHRILINEIDTGADYLELRNRTPWTFAGGSVDVEGWRIEASGAQGQTVAVIEPFRSPTILPLNSFLVIGDGAMAPAELPAGVPYINLGAPLLAAGNLPFGNDELSCALYDQYGRLVDLVRTTGHDDTVVHNHPRSPSAWNAFTGAARRVGSGLPTILGRNPGSYDTNTGADFRTASTRTMGSGNFPGPVTWFPGASSGLDVRLHSGLGGGFTLILNGGAERSGNLWNVFFDLGHLEGQGPLLGLGPNALNNGIWASTTPPFFGLLDAQGSARLDVPSGTIAPGLALDFIFILVDGFQISVITPILEYDS